MKIMIITTMHNKNRTTAMIAITAVKRNGPIEKGIIQE